MRAATLAFLGLACPAFACGGADQLDRRQVSGTVESGHTVADVPVRGFQVEVVTVSRGTIEGELLAADGDGLWVLSASGPAAIPRSEVREVGVDLRDSRAGGYGVWLGLGTASTLSHGFWLVFTAPIWLASGIPTTAIEAADSSETADQGSYDALYQFARFPQGPTDSLRRAIFGELAAPPPAERWVPPPVEGAVPPGAMVPPPPGTEVPPPGTEVPPPDAEVPPPDAEVPPPDAEVPPPDAEVPPPGGEPPPPGAEEPAPPPPAEPRPPDGGVEPAERPGDTPSPSAPRREGGDGLSPPPPSA